MKQRSLFDSLFWIALTGSIILAVVSGVYKFMYVKDYNFVLEAVCDPSGQSCYMRDCTQGLEGCPPNELEVYQRILIRARDFTKCEDNSCAEACKSGAVTCEVIVCDPEEYDCMEPSSSTDALSVGQES